MPENTDLQGVETSQYPAGHLGHLTPSQTSALETLKQLGQTQGYYHPFTDANHAASHDDATLLRFLRARRFDPQQAWTQFKETEDWRRANALEDFYDKIDVQEYEQARRLYPQWTGRRDRRGIPLYLFQIANLDAKTIAEYTQSTAKSEKQNQKKETRHRKDMDSDKDSIASPTKRDQNNVPVKLLRLFALYENLTRFVFPLCTAVASRPHPDTPISQSNNIVDIAGVGLWQFWNLKAHMQDASQLAQAHYPETLDRIFIVGAPSFFPTVWGWIKRWFDPVTVSKIFILSKENMTATLEEYIDLENVPRQYGGRLEFNWGDLPNLDPEIETMIRWQNAQNGSGRRQIPTGPILVRSNEDGQSSTIVAVGSESGTERRMEIGTIVAPLIPSVSATAATTSP